METAKERDLRQGDYIAVNNYNAEIKTKDERDYIVLPVVMMVEGVHNGSHGAIFHSAEELGKSISLWDDIPITINHPTNSEGEFVSVNSEDHSFQTIGIVKNAHMDGTKLKAEAWIDKQKLIAVSVEATKYIQEKRPLEVSIGVFNQELEMLGDWNGEQYTAIAMNHYPDHLALLPSGVGACSWADGCGIRVNNENEKGGLMKNEQLKKLNQQGYAVTLITNQQGYQELMKKAFNTLNAMDSEEKSHYLEEMYDSTMVYRVRSAADREGSLFRQSYTVDEAGKLNLTGQPVEVHRDVAYMTFEELKGKLNINNKKEDNMVDEKKPCGNCMEKVVELINNKDTHFTGADREWLLGLDELTLNKLFPKEVEVQVNQEQAVQALKEVLNDTDKLMEILPESVKNEVQTGLAFHKARKAELIKQIQANTAEGTWEENDLNAMDISILEKIAKSAHVESKADYSGQGGNGSESPAVHEQDDAPEALYPAGFKVE